MSNITITDDGKVLQTKEIDGQEYFNKQEIELARVETQIEKLQNVRLQILERLKQKPSFDEVVVKMQENEKIEAVEPEQPLEEQI
jgi:hypothetical protein